MRAAPKPPAEVKRKPAWTCEARVVLITRLFGGGARTREVDEVCWLRSAAAKSAMRSWWRATHAQDFDSLDALRKRERELFGAPGTFDKEGKVQGGPGALEVTTSGQLAVAPERYEEPMTSSLSYGLFPARKTETADAARVAAASDQSFAKILLTSWSSDSEDREALLESLRLWLTLGGAGARTRRGAGAIAVAKAEEARKLGLPASTQELEAFLRRHCARQNVTLDSVFCLARTRKVFLGLPEATGEQAQKKLLTALRKARQERPKGGSAWPEANAVRLKYDQPKLKDSGQYPRSVLGLPIVLHFKNDQPPDHQILGAIPKEDKWEKLERYSSPILLRPVRVWDGRTEKYVPVAIFTDCTLPAAARPLVTTTPKDDPKAKDVITTYDILKSADATLKRIEDVFSSEHGFRALI